MYSRRNHEQPTQQGGDVRSIPQIASVVGQILRHQIDFNGSLRLQPLGLGNQSIGLE